MNQFGRGDSRTAFSPALPAGSATGFPDGRHARIVSWTGNAARGESRRSPARATLGRARPAVRLLVVGGSLGAWGLNDRVPAALACHPQRSLESMHQADTGTSRGALARAYHRGAGDRAEVRRVHRRRSVALRVEPGLRHLSFRRVEPWRAAGVGL